MTAPNDHGDAPEPTAKQRLEHAIRTRDSLQLLRVELEDSIVDENGVVFHLRSPAGNHEVELRRPNWANLEPVDVANFVAQKVVNEIRWRRNRG